MTTDWTSAAAILAAGIVLGVMFIYFFRRNPATDDSELRRLETKRDDLVKRLRALDPSAADERTRLEVETAQTLREIDAKKTAGAPTTVDPIKRATMIGFAWGAGSVLLLAGLAYMVMRSAQPREANAPVTGGQPQAMTTMAPAEAPADPAVQQLEAAVQKAPNDLNTRIELAKAYLEHDNLMGVFNQTQYVLAKQPNDARALTYQALVRMAMGQNADADSMLQHATQSDPTLIDAWVALAWAKTTEGKAKEAEAAIAEAARRHPEEKARLEQVYAQMKQQAAARRSPGAGELPINHPPVDATGGGPESPIHVTIDITGAAKAKLTGNAIVFVIARGEGVTAGPPAAVKRIAGGTFPMTVDLTSADSMMGQPLPPRVRLEARIDTDGNPLTKDPNDPVVVQDGVAAGSSVTLRLH